MSTTDFHKCLDANMYIYTEYSSRDAEYARNTLWSIGELVVAAD